MKKTILAALLLTMAVSCKKETSVEGGGGGNNNSNPVPTLGANCRPRQINLTDSLGKGLLSITTQFNANGVGTQVDVYDSTTSTLELSEPLNYIGDTLKISDSLYFLLDATKRVKEFVAIQTNNGAKETFRFKYNYDVNGYLKTKDLYSSALPLPIPLIRFTYTWTGDNMVAIDGSVVVPGVTQKILTATLEYDATATAKNFLNIFPDAGEVALYLMALDLGKRSKNLVKRIQVKTYDDMGAVDATTTTEFSKYKFSTDGYLLEWVVSGDEPGLLPFPVGRNAFKYFCR